MVCTRASTSALAAQAALPFRGVKRTAAAAPLHAAASSKPTAPSSKIAKREQQEPSGHKCSSPTLAKKRKRTVPKASSTPSSSGAVAKSTVTLSPSPPLLDASSIRLHTTLAAPKLPFCLRSAMRHLASVDVRFRPLLRHVALKPFLELHRGEVDELDLWRSLVTSILGQQVSWLAARAIVWRFCALFDPQLPAQPDYASRSRDSLRFPSPLDVVTRSDEAHLRSAGLSGAKARYVLDIAERFAQGRLDVRRIVQMDEDEVCRTLCEIKGVGPWTAQMLLIFMLRRPDVLPVGDLGVQRGMLLFHTAGEGGPTISERKKQQQPTPTPRDEGTAAVGREGGSPPTIVGPSDDGTEATGGLEGRARETGAAAEWQSDVLTGPDELALLLDEPPPTTAAAAAAARRVPPLPASSGLTREKLAARKNKKEKGNVYLAPAEMEALAERWRPYRSVATFFMWAIVGD